jgi:hypothetical protein
MVEFIQVIPDQKTQTVSEIKALCYFSHLYFFVRG